MIPTAVIAGVLSARLFKKVTEYVTALSPVPTTVSQQLLLRL